MAVLTVQEVREHLQTALPDAALERIINSAWAAIDRQCGALAETTPGTYDSIVELNYRTSALPFYKLMYDPATVTEVASMNSLGVATVLTVGADEDYVIDGQLVRRVNGFWGSITRATYVPALDSDRRQGTLLHLIDLDLNAQPGQKFSGAATWQESYADYETEKQRLLWELCAPDVFA